MQPAAALKSHIQRCLQYWQKRLLMQDWDMTLYVNPFNEDNGNARAMLGAREADIVIDAAFTGDVDGLVCHEVLHMVFDPLDTFSRQWAELLPIESRRVFLAQWDNHIERLVDQLQKGMCDKTTPLTTPDKKRTK